MKKEYFLLLIMFSFVFVCASVNALSDLQIVACESAHSNDACDELEGLDLVMDEECCSALGKCCVSVSIDEFKVVLIKEIINYFSESPILSTAELKDMIYAYFTAKGNTVDLDVTGKYSGKKLVDTYNKIKDYPVQNNNIKDSSKYSNKEVFLVSDENWKQVLTLVPLSVWTNNDKSITKYPLLIYYKEGNAFDIDSVYYFLEQYDTNRISYFGTLPDELKSLLQNKFTIQQKTNANDYWKEYKDVVYVEDNYELALLASTYASLINAPLIIKGYNDNIDLSGKNIICVGQPTQNCHEKYSQSQLQKEYTEKADTNKIILVNPNDLNTDIEEEFTPERSKTPIYRLYGETSLASPILASAKHELIIFSKQTNHSLVIQNINKQIKDSSIKAEYLTIIASPLSIQMSKEVPKSEDYFTFPGLIEEVDNHIYGNPNNNFLQEISVGRIFGISIGDVSSYIARDAFYLDITKNYKNVTLIAGDIGLESSGALAFKKLLELSGFNVQNLIDFNDNRNNYNLNLHGIEDDSLIIYWGHGGSFGLQSFGSDNNQLNGFNFSPALFLTQACSTCDFDATGNKKSWLFCANMLRKGVIGYVGGVTGAGAEISPNTMAQDLILNNLDLGNLMKNYKNRNIIIHNSLDDIKRQMKENGVNPQKSHEYFYILLGDPTFKFRSMNYPINSVDAYKIRVVLSDNVLTIKIPRILEKTKITSYANERIYKINIFTSPIGNEQSYFYRGNQKIYKQDNSIELENSFDIASYIFSVDVPNNKEIASISKVIYSDDLISKEITELPIFQDNGVLSNNAKKYFAFFFKDPYIKNRYWFNIYESLGGNPLIIENNILQKHELKLILNMNNTI